MSDFRGVSRVDIEQLLEQLGTPTAVARSQGWAPRTFLTFCHREGLKAPERKAPLKSVQSFDEPVSEVEMLRQRNAELEKVVREGRDEDVKAERLLLRLEAAMQKRTPIYKPKVIRPSQRREAHSFVLLWSDTHAAETVSREETNGINAYSWEIMLRRHEQLRRGVLSYLEHRPYPVDTLHVLGLGDMLSGNIHEELAETNEMPLAEATIQFGLDGAEWLDSFTPHFRQIKFAGVVGNHPRAHKKPRAKQSHDNADWLVYQTMALRLKQSKNITFDIPKSAAWPVMICDRWRLLAWHGDGVRSTMPGVPWGGVMRRVNALQAQYTQSGLPIDVFACGHFHTANVVESAAGRVAMNGSVKGPDEYSLKAFGHGQPPRQVLLTFHPRWGLTDVSFIDLDPPADASPVLRAVA